MDTGVFFSWGKETKALTLYLLKKRIWFAPNNVSKWQLGYILFKGLS
jgi:hypothetical protein